MHLHPATSSDARSEQLARLVYELLDAHTDTEQLLNADHTVDELRRRAHLDYLRDLQRIAREVLAHAA